MHKVEIPQAKLTIAFPENIYELTSGQYHYYIQLVVMLSRGHINLMEFKVMWVYHLMNLKYSGKRSEEKDLALAQLVELTTGFFSETEMETGDIQISPITNCALNHCKQFHYNGRTYFGPADALGDVTIGQFLDGLALANAYSKEPDIKYLQQLFALFHTFKPKFGKPKPLTNTLLTTLEDHHLFGFYFFFTSAVDFLTSQDIQLVNGDTYNFSPLFSSKEEGKSIGPKAVLFDLAQSGLFGTIDKTRDTLMMDSLIFLLDSHLKAQKLKKK